LRSINNHQTTMKKIVLLSALIITAGLMSFIQANKTFVEVHNYSGAEEQRPDRRGRSENEIIINRISSPSAGYNIYIFHTSGNAFRRYIFNRPSTTAFTEAIVYTRNDSTFDIRLQNGGNELDFFSLQCSGNQVNLWTETK
jgi:hypothetical protein